MPPDAERMATIEAGSKTFDGVRRRFLAPDADGTRVVDNTIPAEDLAQLQHAATHTMELADAVRPRINTLIHGDFRLANVIFGGAHPVMFDWGGYELQNRTRSCLVFDVSVVVVPLAVLAWLPPTTVLVVVLWCCGSFIDRAREGWHMKDVAFFLTGVLVTDKPGVETTEWLLEQYRQALVADPHFPDAEKATWTTEHMLDE